MLCTVVKKPAYTKAIKKYKILNEMRLLSLSLSPSHTHTYAHRHTTYTQAVNTHTLPQLGTDLLGAQEQHVFTEMSKARYILGVFHGS